MAPRQKGLVTSTQPDPEGGGLLDEVRRDPVTAPPPAPPAPERAPAGQGQSAAPVAVTKADTAELRTTRMTLDLREDDRRRLDMWAAQVGMGIGRPRLGSAAVLRAVVEALTDPERARPDVVDSIAEILAEREARGLNTGP